VHPGNVRVGLRHVADARADGERRFRDVEAEHAHAAALGHEKPEQRLEHRALAGAVRPEQADRARRERRRHVAHRAIFSVGDGHALERDDRGSLRHPRFIYGSVCYSVPLRPKSSARSRMKPMTFAMCSSSGMPSAAAPSIRSSRFTPRANALSFIRFFTELASRSRMLLLGRTYDAAVMKPASSSHAKSVFSSRLSRATPVISIACDLIARIIH